MSFVLISSLLLRVHLKVVVSGSLFTVVFRMVQVIFLDEFSGVSSMIIGVCGALLVSITGSDSIGESYFILSKGMVW